MTTVCFSHSTHNENTCRATHVDLSFTYCIIFCRMIFHDLLLDGIQTVGIKGARRPVRRATIIIQERDTGTRARVGEKGVVSKGLYSGYIWKVETAGSCWHIVHGV